MRVVIQLSVMIMVMPLKSNQVRNTLLLRPLRTLLPNPPQSLVMGTPRNLTLLIRQLLRNPQLVALIPHQHINTSIDGHTAE